MSHPSRAPSAAEGPLPRLIAWETTRACPLACKHCRAAAQPTAEADELSTEEGFRLLDRIAAFAKPTIILTGGEPMLRADIYQVAAHARDLGLRAVMAPCGLLINDETAAKLAASGIGYISISLDGATAESHDAFRGVPGAFEGSLRGIEAAKRAGLQFQINTTVTRHNVEELPAILDLAVALGASAFNPFLLVPTGRGRLIADQEISARKYEEVLSWLAEQENRPDILMRVTCAPHYQRILRQGGPAAGAAHAPKGCLGGKAFAFISSRGKVQICGFLDVECGDLRSVDFDFKKIWETSRVFREVRDPNNYGGRCGYCEYRYVCGGCRARAFALTGDYMSEEPFCTYQPKLRPGKKPGADAAETTAENGMDELDRKIVTAIQSQLPVAERPFDVLAKRLKVDGCRLLQRLADLKGRGLIRRLGPIFDSRRLGYVSTLVAAQVPPDQLAETAARVNRLPGVTHNYSRHHAYNMWFTLTARSEAKLEQTLEQLRRETGLDTFHSLGALAVYKIRVVFDLQDNAAAPNEMAVASAAPSDPVAELNDEQKHLVRLLQDDIPLTPEPFAPIAARLGWPVDQVLRQIRQWLDQGVIRRFGGVVRHHRIGFTANGMAVFDVPGDRIDEAGRRLAQYPQVSHCYHRPSLPGWPYNLFAMVHGRSETEVRELAAEMAQAVDAERSDVLFSITEFKKTSNRYFLDEMDSD
ncbi:MAG: radical SAM protein [Anaerolineaceae bacterium]|nr:radical SAM protein [Anaerolineaceae bacterium]